MPQEKAPILQALPPELHFNIVKYLDYSTFLALRRTNRYLREVADAVGCSDLEKASLVRAAEQYPRHAKNFGCCRCFRVLPARKFGDKQRKKSYRKGKSNSFSRFCFDCGLRKELYPPGCRIVKDGVEMIYCRECRLVREGQYCHSCWRCWSCLQLSRVGHEPESAAEDVVDVREVIFGSHNRSLSTRDRVPVACPRCRQDKIKGKALEWYECIDDEQELERKWGMAEFEAASGETASPCSQQVSARGGRTTEVRSVLH